MRNAIKILAIIAAILLVPSRPTYALFLSSNDAGAGMLAARPILTDTNNGSLEGGLPTVRFRMHSLAVASLLKTAPSAPVSQQEVTSTTPARPPVPPELRSDGDTNFPMKGSPLPLVSLIGFLLLLSGMIPAMRLRKNRPAHRYGARRLPAHP